MRLRGALLIGCLMIGCTSQITKPIGDNFSHPIAVALDPARARGYVVNANSDLAFETGSVMILNLTTPMAPTLLTHSANPATVASHSSEVILDTANLNLLIAN